MQIDRGTDPMETNTSTSPQPSSSSSPSTSTAPQSSSTDVAAPPIRVFRLIRPTRETLIRGTQTSTPPSEPSTSNADGASTSSQPAAESSKIVTEQTDYPENPRKVICLYSYLRVESTVFFLFLETDYFSEK